MQLLRWFGIGVESDAGFYLLGHVEAVHDDDCQRERPDRVHSGPVLTEQQEFRLADLVQYNLESIRSYLLKEEFLHFRLYTSSN